MTNELLGFDQKLFYFSNRNDKHPKLKNVFFYVSFDFQCLLKFLPLKNINSLLCRDKFSYKKKSQKSVASIFF